MQDSAISLKAQLDQQKSVVESLISNSKVFVIISLLQSSPRGPNKIVFSLN